MDFGWSEAVSAFAGAAFAFAIDLLRERISIRREQRDSCNRALLALTRIYVDLQNIWRQVYMEPVAEAAKHGLLPPPVIVMPLAGGATSSTTIDIASLVFLTRSSVPDLPNRLALLETRYLHHLETEALRSTAHLEMQAKFEEAGLVSGSSMSVADAERLCGPRLWQQLCAMTDSQVEGLQRTIRDMEEFQDHFLEVVRFEFPASTFVKFQLADATPGKTFAELTVPRAAAWRRAIRAIRQHLMNKKSGRRPKKLARGK
jgi:hypothetical protein